jgi:hypothetical protein
MPFPQVDYSRQDAQLTVLTALPAAGATANTSSIDLGIAAPTLAGTDSSFTITIPATTTATGQTFTFTVQDSDDNSSFASVAPMASRVITGVSNATAATTFSWRFPSSVRRYVRVSAVASATTGNQTAISFTSQVLT